MTTVTISGRWLYFQGVILSASGLTGSFTPPAAKPKTQERTGPFDLAPVRSQTGYVDVDDMSFSMWFDTDYTTLVSLLHLVDATGRVCAWGYNGDTLGNKFEGVQVHKATFTPTSEAAELTPYEVTFQVTPNGLEHGQIVHVLSEQTIAGNTEAAAANHGTMATAVAITSSSVANPSVITSTAHGLVTGDTVLIAGHTGSTPTINGSHVVTKTGANTYTIPVNVTVGGTGGTGTRTSSRNGGAGYLHVTALNLDSGTGIVFKLRDSADNVTFVDLGTFTTITVEYADSDVDTGTAERIAIAGNIDRYVACSWAYGGAPGGSQDTTFWMGLTRKE